MTQPDAPITTCVDRQTLYEELWHVPGTQLAKKYGISDVALGKACRRHEIPRPPSGYWTMRKHGYEVERMPLPPVADPRLDLVEFHPVAAADRPNRHAGAEQSRGQIRVADDLKSPHPLVEGARKQLRAAQANDSRIVSTNPETALSIAVAASSITRALRIMDALIRAWEQAGGSVKLGVKSWNNRICTGFGIGEDVVPVTLAERTEAIPDWKPPKGYWHRYPPHIPNGQFVLSVDHLWREHLRSTWADGKRQRLEDILDSVFDGLMVHAEHEKRRRLDYECEARQKAAAEQRRAQKEKWVKEEKARRESLLSDVDSWHQAERVRAFLSAMREAVAAGKMRITDEKVYAEWSGWADWFANHIDPLVRAKPRAIPTARLTTKPMGELDLTFRTREVLVQLGVDGSDSMYRLTEERIGEVHKENAHRVWNEVCVVLEGLGYNMSGRKYWR